MALSDNILRTTQGLGNRRFIVKNGKTVYAGAFVSMDISTGEILPIDTTATAPAQSFVGVAQEKVVGDGSADCLISTESFILHRVSVTGVASQADLWKLVYATDDNTLTITKPSAMAIPVGVVVYWYSGTECDVKIFGMNDSALWRSGRVRAYIPLTAAAGAVYVEKLSGYGRITSFTMHFYGDGAGTASDVTFALYIAGNPVTGSALQVLLADSQSQGGKKTATPTANNLFRDGDELTVNLDTVTAAFTAGTAFAEVEYEVIG